MRKKFDQRLDEPWDIRGPWWSKILDTPLYDYILQKSWTRPCVWLYSSKILTYDIDNNFSQLIISRYNLKSQCRYFPTFLCHSEAKWYYQANKLSINYHWYDKNSGILMFTYMLTKIGWDIFNILLWKAIYFGWKKIGNYFYSYGNNLIILCTSKILNAHF